MLVNGLLAQFTAIFAETLDLGEKLGFSREFLWSFLPNTAVAPPFLKTKAELIRANDQDVQFPLTLMRKDLHLLGVTAYEHHQPLFFGKCSTTTFCTGRRNGARSGGL